MSRNALAHGTNRVNLGYMPSHDYTYIMHRQQRAKKFKKHTLTVSHTSTHTLPAHEIMRQPNEIFGIPCLPMKKKHHRAQQLWRPYYGASHILKDQQPNYSPTDEMCEIDRFILLKRPDPMRARTHIYMPDERDEKTSLFHYLPMYSTNSLTTSHSPLRLHTYSSMKQRKRIIAIFMPFNFGSFKMRMRSMHGMCLCVFVSHCSYSYMNSSSKMTA